MTQFVLRRADRIVVLGNGMRETLIAKANLPLKAVEVIPPWAEPELAPVEPDPQLKSRLGVPSQSLMVTYAGNMGIMHPLEPLLEAAAQLQGHPVHFVLLGHGVRRAEWESRVKEQKLNNVTFLSFLEQEEFDRLLATSDVSVVALSPGMERFAVPARAFTLLAAGCPMITLMADRADIARLVTESGCGWNVRNAADLVDLIEDLLVSKDVLQAASQKARNLYEKQFAREKGTQRYVALTRDAALGHNG
jgi:glycosyltransferase involved in cell wall biosynthesis